MYISFALFLFIQGLTKSYGDMEGGNKVRKGENNTKNEIQ